MLWLNKSSGLHAFTKTVRFNCYIYCCYGVPTESHFLTEMIVFQVVILDILLATKELTQTPTSCFSAS